MHTIMKCAKESDWQVVRHEVMLGETITILLFNRLSFSTAMKLVNFLNGGGAQFTEESFKVIEMCRA